MTRVPALGHPSLWQAALALRERGHGYRDIAAALRAGTGRDLSQRAVYALLEYARLRTGRETVVLVLDRDAAARAAAAARVRGCTVPRLVEQAVALLLDDPALLDAVLDDGVATPREEVA